MKSALVVCALLAMPLARPVFAGPLVSGCCACLIKDHDTAVPALFCVSPMNAREAIAAEARCADIPDASFLCVADDQAQTAGVTAECVEELDSVGILCPTQHETPALGHTALAGLAGLLGMAGASTLRRRTRRP